MRTITIPGGVAVRALRGPVDGVCLEVPVKVDWPELQLTEEQVVANAVAVACGQPAPFPDLSIFSVRVPFVAPLDHGEQ